MTSSDQDGSELLSLLRDGRPRPAIGFALDLLAGGMSCPEIIKGVLVPAQRQLGVLWETNRLNVADGHAATAVADGVLGALSFEAAHEPLRGDVVVACAQGEHHTLPARMGVELLRAEGWEVTFLGGSLPPDDLQRFAAQHEPDIVVISCTVPLFLPGARRCFAAVSEIGMPAVAVGAAFGADSVRASRLGASGWLGAGMELRDLVDGLEPGAAGTPASVEALTLDLGRDALVADCWSAIVEQVPATRSYSGEQVTSTQTDIGYILRFLGVAIDLDEPSIFEDFLSWLTEVLRSRHVPPRVLTMSLQTIAATLLSAGLTEAAGRCSPGPLAVSADKRRASPTAR